MKLILAGAAIMLASCGQPYSWESFKQCIESAPKVMSYPVQMEYIGKSYHGIGAYQSKGRSSYEWGTYVMFGSRYKIAMGIDVELNDGHTKVVKTVGEPRFHLYIYKTITKDADGGYRISYESDIKFTRKEWSEMVKHRDDIEKMLAVLNIKVNKAKLQNFDELVEAELPEPKYRIKLSP